VGLRGLEVGLASERIGSGIVETRSRRKSRVWTVLMVCLLREYGQRWGWRRRRGRRQPKIIKYDGQLRCENSRIRDTLTGDTP
jgi:hypothetical protein